MTQKSCFCKLRHVEQSCSSARVCEYDCGGLSDWRRTETFEGSATFSHSKPKYKNVLRD